MKLYKLTDEHGRTYGDTQWGPGVTHETDGKGALCGPGWLHAYTDPLLALMLNPIHANFQNPRLWEAEGEIGADDRGLKCGTTKLTIVRELPLPKITAEHRVRFAILCAAAVVGDNIPQWAEWAKERLSGGRSRTTAWAAARAARAADAAAWAAAWAARAADAAAWAADAADAADAAARAARAADAAAWAARAARAAVDLTALAREAVYGAAQEPVT